MVFFEGNNSHFMTYHKMGSFWEFPISPFLWKWKETGWGQLLSRHLVWLTPLSTFTFAGGNYNSLIIRGAWSDQRSGYQGLLHILGEVQAWAADGRRLTQASVCFSTARVPESLSSTVKEAKQVPGLLPWPFCPVKNIKLSWTAEWLFARWNFKWNL